MSIRDSLKDLGIFTGEVKFAGKTLKLRTLSSEDDIFIFERVQLESKSEMSKLCLARIYTLCLMILEIDGVSVYNTIFDSDIVDLDNSKRYDIVKEMSSELLLMDRKVLSYLFKLAWSWGDTQAFKKSKIESVEDFLTPEELSVYQEMQQVLEIEKLIDENKENVEVDIGVQENLVNLYNKITDSEELVDSD